jgi:hypothetical protein
MNISNKAQALPPAGACTTPGLSCLYKASGAAALVAGALFLAAFIEFITTSLQPGTAYDWLSLFGNNWLVTLFKLHAGDSGVRPGQLYVFNPLDICIMALVALMFLGLYVALKRTSKIWSLIALAQPFLGMAIFIMTGNAGRSAIMGSVLVISLVMLRNKIFGKASAYIGVLASVFLLIGDLSADIARSSAVAILIGVGYLFLVVWLFMAARKLFWLSHGTPIEEVYPCL